MEGIFVLFLSALLLFTAHNSHSYRVKTDKDAVAYLTQYGYVDPQVMPKGFTLKDCNKKLKEFQKLARVDVTGILDSSTIKAMNSPRCGCPDFINLSFKDSSADTHSHHDHHTHNQIPYHRHRHHSSAHKNHGNRSSTSSGHRNQSSTFINGSRRRSKRFVLSDRQWNKQLVTYSIVKYPSRYDFKISTREIEDAIQKAFHIWGQHINLKFGYRPNEIDVDIEISFVGTYHGDSYPFDGAGKTLAHAFFPGTGLGGDVHFEEDEDWRLGAYGGVDLLYVAVHEIGHSLGLGHSSEYGAIMYPIYRGYFPNLQLHFDDIRGIQTLYGRPSGNVTPTPSTTPRATRSTSTTSTLKPYVNSTTTTTTTPRPNPGPGADNHLCEDPNIDAITTIFDDTILVFQGANVYEIGKEGQGILAGWPKGISSYFRGLESHLDCVLTRSNGKSYFFKGGKYWRFTGRRMDAGYPRSISEYFPGIPDSLDAAFEWDEEFVFVKDDKFWRFNTRKRPQVQSIFPMPISHWNLSGRIDAAFTAPTNQTVYFFQGPYFWELDKISHKIKRNSQKTYIAAERWFGCWEP